MKLLKRKSKTNRVGNSFYFGEYDEVDLGLALTVMEDVSQEYKDINHFHKESTEYYLVLNGEAVFEVSGASVVVDQNGALMVNAGEIHRLVKVYKFPCTIISISTKKIRDDKVVVE